MYSLDLRQFCHEIRHSVFLLERCLKREWVMKANNKYYTFVEEGLLPSPRNINKEIWKIYPPASPIRWCVNSSMLLSWALYIHMAGEKLQRGHERSAAQSARKHGHVGPACAGEHPKIAGCLSNSYNKHVWVRAR